MMALSKQTHRSPSGLCENYFWFPAHLIPFSVALGSSVSSDDTMGFSQGVRFGLNEGVSIKKKISGFTIFIKVVLVVSQPIPHSTLRTFLELLYVQRAKLRPCPKRRLRLQLRLDRTHLPILQHWQTR